MLLRNCTKIFVLALVACFSVGCANVSIQSIYDQNTKLEIKKLATVINGGAHLPEQWQTDLSKALQQQFSNVGIESNATIISPLALNEEQYIADVLAQKPDAVLIIKTNGGTKDPFGGMLEIRYDVGLLTPDFEKRVWRAAITNEGGTAMITLRMQKMAKTIVSRLQQDGAIPTPSK